MFEPLVEIVDEHLEKSRMTLERVEEVVHASQLQNDDLETQDFYRKALEKAKQNADRAEAAKSMLDNLIANHVAKQ